MFRLRSILLLLLVQHIGAQTPIASMPTQRFKPWDESTIPVNLRQAIGWTTSGLWNQPTSMPLEETAFVYIERQNPTLASTITRVMSKEQWDCWINHYEDFWWIDLPEKAQNAYTMLGYTEFVWDTESFIPGPMTLIWDALNTTQQDAVKTLCYTKELWANDDLRLWVETKPITQMVYPTKRYTEWKDLDVNTQTMALQAGYTPSSWNIPSFGFEKIHFRRLLKTFPNIANNVYAMGFKAPEWNCWINHYEDFFWKEMPQSVQGALATLGYNQPLWDAGNSPPLAALQEWEYLSPVQQEAMKQLCYTRDIWDEIDLRVWVEDLPLSQMIYPTIRYTPWNQLSYETKQLAYQAGYTNATWDKLDSHPHERRSMRLLLKEHPSAFDAITKMGIKPAEWNAFVTHYNAFYWKDLERLGKTRYLLTFNWTANTWDNETMPEAWHALWWWQMPNNLKEAATSLGYEDITWDVRDLNIWENYGLPSAFPSSTPSLAPSSVPSASPSGVPSLSPSSMPSLLPTLSLAPSAAPSGAPSGAPSSTPSDVPSSSPSLSKVPSAAPSSAPSATPSMRPSVSMAPSLQPSASPSSHPTATPSSAPSGAPSSVPTLSLAPSGAPSSNPTGTPSSAPSGAPSLEPTISNAPTGSNAPSDVPSLTPSGVPSDVPSITPTTAPTTFEDALEGSSMSVRVGPVVGLSLALLLLVTLAY